MELTLWQQWWCTKDRVLDVKLKHYHSQAPEVFLFTIKNDRYTWSNSTPDMNLYGVKLRKDLQVDILSNTVWYLVALGQ